MSGLCSEMEKFGKGISSASRFSILQELFRGPRTVSELVSVTGQSQPCVSQHLKTLKSADLVADERQGKMVYYRVNAEYLLLLLQKLSEDVKKKKRPAVVPARRKK